MKDLNMKKLLVLAYFASSLAFAAGSVNGIATSTVGGGVSSASLTPGLNLSSFHAATAGSTNSTDSYGKLSLSSTGAYGRTETITAGSTFSNVFGFGAGEAKAGAGQYGFGSVSLAGVLNCNGILGSLDAKSETATNTWSNAVLTLNGDGSSASTGGAKNSTSVSFEAGSYRNGVFTSADGKTTGNDYGTTTGAATNATVDAGGSSAQVGVYNATVTNSFTTVVKTPKCTSGCGND